MAVVSCPHCSARLRAPEGARGRMKCPKCATVFILPLPTPRPAFEIVEDDDPPSPAPPPPPAPPSPQAPPRPTFEVVEDDDDEPPPPAPPPRNPFAIAAVGARLLSIGLFCYTGLFVLLVLFELLGLVTDLTDGLFALPGLAGVGMTVLSLVGGSLCIAGPQAARGLAVATVAVSAVHVVLTLIGYSEVTKEPGGGRNLLPVGGSDWLALGTTLWVLHLVLPVLVYSKSLRLGSDAWPFVAAAGCEVARLVLVLLTLQSLARQAKDPNSATRAGRNVVVTGMVCGGAAVVYLLVFLVVVEGEMRRSARYVLPLTGILVCGGYALMSLLAALAAHDTHSGLAMQAARAARRRDNGK